MEFSQLFSSKSNFMNLILGSIILENKYAKRFFYVRQRIYLVLVVFIVPVPGCVDLLVDVVVVAVVLVSPSSPSAAAAIASAAVRGRARRGVGRRVSVTGEYRRVITSKMLKNGKHRLRETWLAHLRPFLPSLDSIISFPSNIFICDTGGEKRLSAAQLFLNFKCQSALNLLIVVIDVHGSVPATTASYLSLFSTF